MTRKTELTCGALCIASLAATVFAGRDLPRALVTDKVADNTPIFPCNETINAALDETDPTWARADSYGDTDPACNADFYLDGRVVYYDVYTVCSPTGGLFEAELLFANFDGMLYLYCDPFDPLDPLVNGIIVDDYDGTDDAAILASDGINLAANTDYHLVVSSYDQYSNVGPYELCLGGDWSTSACALTGACCRLDGYTCTIESEDYCVVELGGSYGGDGSVCPSGEEQVVDGGFELGPNGGAWIESSGSFGSPICDVGTCGDGGGTGPHSGRYWAWFGRVADYEVGQVVQNVTIPVGATTLTFWVEQIVCDSPSDYLALSVDGNSWAWITDGSDPACGVLGYRQVFVDISAFANGGVHQLIFQSEVFSDDEGVTNFFLDDVSILGPTTCLPTGACCFLNGRQSCQELTQGECERLEGDYKGDGTTCEPGGEQVADPGFEGGTPNAFWNESHPGFGVPICGPSCDFCGGSGPRTGEWCVRFGDYGDIEESPRDGTEQYVFQDVVIPVGATTLTFWVEQPVCDSYMDLLGLEIDDNLEWLTTGEDPNCGIIGYRQVAVDITPYADGGVHEILFGAVMYGMNEGSSCFLIDDVSIRESECPTIGGACCFFDKNGDCAVLTQTECENLEGDYLGDDTTCTPGAEHVADPGFEGGTPNAFWSDFYEGFDPPICDASCDFCGGTGPRTGNWCVRLGGDGGMGGPREESARQYVYQDVVIPIGATTLTFWIEQPVCDSYLDTLVAVVDNNLEWFTTGGDLGCGVIGYRQVAVDITAYADGGVHQVLFGAEFYGLNEGLSCFLIDDVSILGPGSCPTIGGACCLLDESCEHLTEEDCILANGLFLGEGTLCELRDSCPANCNENDIFDDEETAPDFDPSELDGAPGYMCASAPWLCPGPFAGETLPLSPTNGVLYCGIWFGNNKAWYRYRPKYDGTAFLGVAGLPINWLFAVYTDCPGGPAQQVACNNIDWQDFQWNAIGGQTYYISIAGVAYAHGPFEGVLLGPWCLPNEYDINGNRIPDDCDCLPDVNGDCVVDEADLLAVFLLLGQSCLQCPENVNQDGVVDVTDYQIVLSHLGYVCPFSLCPESPIGRPAVDGHVLPSLISANPKLMLRVVDPQVQAQQEAELDYARKSLNRPSADARHRKRSD